MAFRLHAVIRVCFAWMYGRLEETESGVGSRSLGEFALGRMNMRFCSVKKGWARRKCKL